MVSVSLVAVFFVEIHRAIANQGDIPEQPLGGSIVQIQAIGVLRRIGVAVTGVVTIRIAVVTELHVVVAKG